MGTNRMTTLRSPERDALLISLYPTLMEPAEIVAALNELPGTRISVGQLSGYAQAIRIRRSKEYRTHCAKRYGSTTEVTPNSSTDTLTPELIDREGAREWADANGVPPNVQAINLARTKFGLPPFMVAK